MDIRTEFIVGKETSSQWSGVYGYRPEEVINPAELFAVIRISADTKELGLKKLVRLLLDELQQIYYEEDRQFNDNVEKLENAVWKMKNRMDIILSREDEVVQSGIDIEMALVVVEKEYLYAAVIGESKIYVQRGDSFVDISKGLLDANMMGFLRTGSLKLVLNDRIALATSKCAEIDENSINQALMDLDINKIAKFETSEGTSFIMLADEKLPWRDREIKEEPKLEKEIILPTEEMISQPKDESVELTETSEQSYDEIPEEVSNIEEDSITNNQEFSNEPVPIKLRTPEEIRAERVAKLKAEGHLEEDMPNSDFGEKSTSVAALSKVKETLSSLKNSIALRLQKMREERANRASKEESMVELSEPEIRAGSIKDEGDDINIAKADNLNIRAGKSHGMLEEPDLKDTEISMDKLKNHRDESRDSFFDDELVVAGSDHNNENNILNKIKSILLATGTFLKDLWIHRISPLFKNNRTYAKFLRDVGDKLKELFGGIWNIFKKEIIGTGDRRDLYLKSKRRRRNRIILAVAIVIIFIFIVIEVRNKQAEQREQQRRDNAYAQVMNLQNQLDSIEPQINDAATGNLDKKASILSALDTINSSINTQKATGLYLDNLNKLATRVQTDEDAVKLITPVTDSQVVTDIGKIYPEADLTDIVFSNDSIYVSDDTRNVVYQIGTDVNSRPVDFASGLTKPYILVKDTATSAGDIIFYDNDPTSAIGKISVKDNGKVTRFPNLSTGVIGKVDAAALFSGNEALYEIHQNYQQIFKRRKIGNSYDTGGALDQTTNPPVWKEKSELGDAINISVPYEVYVLVKDQGLQRYLSGGDNTVTFDTFVNTLQSDFDSINKATCMVATDKYLVICDPTNSRVMLFSIQNNQQKNLVFQTQYVYRGSDTIFKNLRKVTLNDKQDAIFVLDGTRVIRLDIKQ